MPEAFRVPAVGGTQAASQSGAQLMRHPLVTCGALPRLQSAS